jgi:hypothetical protein
VNKGLKKGWRLTTPAIDYRPLPRCWTPVQLISNATTTTAKSWPAVSLSPLPRPKHWPLPRPRLKVAVPRHRRPHALPKQDRYQARPLPRHWPLPRPKHWPSPRLGPTASLPRRRHAHSLPKGHRCRAPLLRHVRRGGRQRGFGCRRKRGQLVRLREARRRRRGKRGTQPTPLPRAPSPAHRPPYPGSELLFLEESYRTYLAAAPVAYIGGRLYAKERRSSTRLLEP